jgi:hypothetical protein
MAPGSKRPTTTKKKAAATSGRRQNQGRPTMSDSAEQQVRDAAQRMIDWSRFGMDTVGELQKQYLELWSRNGAQTAKLMHDSISLCESTFEQLSSGCNEAVAIMTRGTQSCLDKAADLSS